MRQFTFWSHTQHWPAIDKRVFGKPCTWPVQSPTTRSAMKVSSVSPERWLTITPHPLDWAILQLNNVKPKQKTLHTRSNVVKFELVLILNYPQTSCEILETLTPEGTRWLSRSGWLWAAGSCRLYQTQLWRCAWGWSLWGHHPPPGC